MTSVFLSYARGDDGEPFDPATSFVARLHRDMTNRAGGQLRVGASGNHDYLVQLEGMDAR